MKDQNQEPCHRKVFPPWERTPYAMLIALSFAMMWATVLGDIPHIVNFIAYGIMFVIGDILFVRKYDEKREQYHKDNSKSLR